MVGNPRRAALFRRARIAQHRHEALDMTPADRLAVARRLIELADAVGADAVEGGSDEPPAYWLSRHRRRTA